jgi:hypothetical protein
VVSPSLRMTSGREDVVAFGRGRTRCIGWARSRAPPVRTRKKGLERLFTSGTCSGAGRRLLVGEGRRGAAAFSLACDDRGCLLAGPLSCGFKVRERSHYPSIDQC